MKLGGIIYIILMLKLYSAKALMSKEFMDFVS